MMREDDSFDELVRAKLQQRSFRSSPEGRAKLEQAINARNAQKRFRMLMGIGFAILAVVGGVIFLGNYLSHGKNTAENSLNGIAKTNGQTALNANTSPIDNPPNGKQSVDQTVISNSSSNNSNASSNQSLSANGNQQHSNSLQNNSSDNSNRTLQQQTGVKNKNKDSNNNNSSSQLTGISQSKKYGQDKTNGPSGADGNVLTNQKSSVNKNSKNVNGKTPVAALRTNSSSHTSNINQSSTKGNGQTSNPTVAVSSSSSHVSDINQTSTKGNGQTSNPTVGVSSSSSHVSDINQTSTTAKGQTSNPSVGMNSPLSQLANQKQSSISSQANSENDSTQDQVAKNNLSSSQTNAVAKKQFADSIANKTNSHSTSLSDSTSGVSANNQAAQRPSGGSVNYFFAEAGMTFIPGFAPGFHSGRSLNPAIGGGWCFHVGMKYSMEVGLHYTFIGHASDSSITYTTTTYAFGSQNQYTDVSLKRLHYASLPVSFTWHLNGKHAITAGVTANYLFATETRWRTYSQSDNNIHSISKFGYGQGINRFDVLLSAGYTRTFGMHWSMRLSAYYGLMDIKNNNWYGVNKFERNKGLQFTIQYAF